MLDVEENIKFAFSMSVFLVIILLPLSVKRSVICCMTHFSCRSVIQACNLSSKILINGGQRHQDLLYETGQQKSCVLQIKTMCLPWVSRRTLRGWNRLWGSLWDIPSWPVMSQALHQLEAFSFDETELLMCQQSYLSQLWQGSSNADHLYISNNYIPSIQNDVSYCLANLHALLTMTSFALCAKAFIHQHGYLSCQHSIFSLPKVYQGLGLHAGQLQQLDVQLNTFQSFHICLLYQ